MHTYTSWKGKTWNNVSDFTHLKKAFDKNQHIFTLK